MSLLFRQKFPFLRLTKAPNVTVFRRISSEVSNSVSSNTSKKESEDKAVKTAPETTNVISADVISGAPEELQYRTVKIYKPTRTAMQSGEHNTKHWRINFDILEGGDRWENPLIGWASRLYASITTEIQVQGRCDSFC
ncbi:9948_t:CDS:2 [Funneliformis mosseae]|uniref:NADH dehydrogenase [ubiquinone] iron-sulfur protein 4, mitochondrial n=2 Tax=Funneliformis TaxID=1117308 RepID=A0A9N9A776_FUNMO|nr:9948_t:CDS:2 [Funneliformis mosseae]